MVLVDTSVWVAHLRGSEPTLKALLEQGKVASHPFVIGELACGHLTQRKQILALLQALPQALTASHDEALRFLELHGLMGRGLGLVDIHLLASARLTLVALWTMDLKLRDAAEDIGVAFR